MRFNQARVDHAPRCFEELIQEERENLTAVVIKDAFSALPTLIAPTQRPSPGEALPEKVRRIALIRLLERNGLVAYEGALKDPRAFAYHLGLFEDYHPEDREAVIAIAVEQMSDEL